jgi:phosphatidylinositol alpha-1,6-mannosyltransferase
VNVVFVTFALTSRLGGEAQYSSRVNRALAELVADGTQRDTRTTTIALWDAGKAATADERAATVGCNGNKVRCIGQFIRALHDRPDLVIYGHVLFLPLAVLARVLAPSARRVLIAYGLEAWEPPSRLRSILVRHFVHQIVAISAHTASRMSEVYKVSPETFGVLPCAIDVTPSPVAAVRREPLSILIVSRLGEHSEHKGVGVLIEAMALVREVVPGATLTVVGDGKDRPRYEALAAELGLADIVTFAGVVSDSELQNYYRRSRIFALPSSKEGFGIVFLEAWLAGLAIVAANRAAARDVIDDNSTGLLVEPTPRAFADALIRLLDSPPLCDSLARVGEMKARETYSHERFVEELRVIIDTPVAS